MLGVRSAALGSVIALRRAPRALRHRESGVVFKIICVCARADSSDCGRHKMSTAQVNERGRALRQLACAKRRQPICCGNESTSRYG